MNALLDAPRSSDSVVAYRNPTTDVKPLDWQTFCTRACALSAELDARPETRWSLVCDDGVEFAI
ncbi:MAG TPA: hypothetical protein VFP95_03010, partial [Gammaproteobacteria bacterium]|nr:hypothetical protein [Gammaproteobacteria bacterium]